MKLQSMTAYGFGDQELSGTTLSCEVRSLNSRYLEVNVRLPRHLLALEVDVINYVKNRLKRGKVDVFFDTGKSSQSRHLPELDSEAAAHYMTLASSLNRLWQKTNPDTPMNTPSVVEFFKLDGVLASDAPERGPQAAEKHKSAVFAALDQALKALVQARCKEGETLGLALGSLLDDIEKGRRAVAEKRDVILPNLMKTYQKRLESSLEILQKSGKTTSQLPEERILAEVAIQSDKVDIDEELTRLLTHTGEFRRLMGAEEAPGRKLDFMCQEMHREVNTMSNKLIQTDVAQHTLEMKQLIERIRQQVQNIE